MDVDYDIPPRIFCDHNLDGYDWREIIGYAHGFFAPGTQWDLVLPEGVKHMKRPAMKDSDIDWSVTLRLDYGVQIGPSSLAPEQTRLFLLFSLTELLMLDKVLRTWPEAVCLRRLTPHMG
jgi:hypothetical protein